MKKLFLLLAFMVCGLASNVFAEQITKFAVVDTDRVYKAFFNFITFPERHQISLRYLRKLSAADLVRSDIESLAGVLCFC